MAELIAFEHWRYKASKFEDWKQAFELYDNGQCQTCKAMVSNEDKQKVGFIERGICEPCREKIDLWVQTMISKANRTTCECRHILEDHRGFQRCLRCQCEGFVGVFKMVVERGADG